MLLSYTLDAGNNRHNMDTLSEIHLGHKTISYKELVGTGKKQLNFSDINLEEATKVIGVNNPMGRGGRVEDIANAVTFLASEEASFVNGAVFVVDGGGEVIADRNGTFVDMGSITVQEADRTGV